MNVDNSVGATLSTSTIDSYGYGFETTLYDTADVECSFLSFNGFAVGFDSTGDNSLTLIEFTGDNSDNSQFDWGCVFFSGSDFTVVTTDVVSEQRYDTIRTDGSDENNICAYELIAASPKGSSFTFTIYTD